MSRHLIRIEPGQRWLDKARTKRTGKKRVIEIMEVQDGPGRGDDTYAVVRNINGTGKLTTISLHRLGKKKLFDLVLVTPQEEAAMKAVEKENAMAHAGVVDPSPARLGAPS